MAKGNHNSKSHPVASTKRVAYQTNTLGPNPHSRSRQPSSGDSDGQYSDHRGTTTAASVHAFDEAEAFEADDDPEAAAEEEANEAAKPTYAIIRGNTSGKEYLMTEDRLAELVKDGKLVLADKNGESLTLTSL
jgi:hypothetical protein